MTIMYVEGEVPERDAVLNLYRSNGWSSAEKPEELMAALTGSHHLVAAYDGSRLVGLANAISDGHLVAYYPHLLVDPELQGKGIGRAMMSLMRRKYDGIHQHMLVAVAEAVGFYENVGFEIATGTVSMWNYDGNDHGQNVKNVESD